MALKKLEAEFAQYAKRYQQQKERRFWRGFIFFIIFYLLAPHLLLAIANRYPAFPDTVLRFLNQGEDSQHLLESQKS